MSLRKRTIVIKLIIFLMILNSSFKTFGQDFKQLGNIKYSQNSIIVENYKLQIGDTVYLGFGSGANKQFIFCWLRPNALTYDVNNPLQGLPPTFANLPVVVKEIKIKKTLGKEYVDVIYMPTTTKLKISIDIYNALLSKEIKGFSERCEIKIE